jgi:hypothetical protein
MKIKMHEIPISDVFNGYQDSDEEGVVAYGGKLNVRPAYQREFVYKDKQRDEVINTVKKEFPLNVMYWVKAGDDHFELLDGQQRTLSICQYLAGDFSIDYQYFHNLTDDEKQKILNYKLMIYICEGSDSEKLDWFKIINIAGEKLYNQELRNAIYTGSWLTDAKRHFSKNGCAAYQLGNKYLTGNAIRQDYLETTLSWIAARDGIQIEEYMAKHQHDSNCNELWMYFNSVINWLETLFPKEYYRPIMKGQPWGEFYNKFHDNTYDATEFEKRIKELLLDDEVQNNKGVYSYLFNDDESNLNLRAFVEKDKMLKYEKQGGICPKCLQHFEYDEMEGDHIIPWRDGGKTVLDNLQMLCRHCNRVKSDK